MADLKEIFKLRMMGEGEGDQQSSEGLMERIAEQGAWGGVMGRDHKANKMGLGWGYLQHSHLS